MKKQLKIKSSALEVIEGKYFYKGALFNGVRFDEDGDYIDSFVMQDGMKISTYEHEYISQAGFDVGFNKLIANGRPQAKFQGKPINSVTFDFREDYCYKERLYVDGILLVELFNYPGGGVHIYNRFIDDVQVWVSFDQNQRISSVNITENKVCNLGYTIGEDGSLISITIHEDFTSKRNEYMDKIPFHIVHDINEFVNMNIYESLSIYQAGVTKEFIDHLVDNNKLNNLKKLWSYYTGIHDSQILKICKNEDFKQLIVKDDTGAKSDFLRLLFANNPQIEIGYEFHLK